MELDDTLGKVLSIKGMDEIGKYCLSFWLSLLGEINKNKLL